MINEGILLSVFAIKINSSLACSSKKKEEFCRAFRSNLIPIQQYYWELLIPFHILFYKADRLISRSLNRAEVILKSIPTEIILNEMSTNIRMVVIYIFQKSPDRNIRFTEAVEVIFAVRLVN